MKKVHSTYIFYPSCSASLLLLSRGRYLYPDLDGIEVLKRFTVR